MDLKTEIRGSEMVAEEGIERDGAPWPPTSATSDALNSMATMSSYTLRKKVDSSDQILTTAAGRTERTPASERCHQQRTFKRLRHVVAVIGTTRCLG
jgi:hypothetical protein